MESFTTKIRTSENKGCPIIPTQRSVTVRHRSRSLAGECREDSFWRAIRIRIFPIVAVIDKTVLKPARSFSVGLLSTVVVQINASKVVPLSVRFDIVASIPVKIETEIVKKDTSFNIEG